MPTQLPLPAKDYSSASEKRQCQSIRNILADHFSAKCLAAACNCTDKYTPELPQPSSGLISDHPGPRVLSPNLACPWPLSPATLLIRYTLGFLLLGVVMETF